MRATDRLRVRLGRAAIHVSAADLERRVHELVDENSRLRGELRTLRVMHTRRTSDAAGANGTGAGAGRAARDRFRARRDYQALLLRLSGVVRDVLPADARILAISRGD